MEVAMADVKVVDGRSLPGHLEALAEIVAEQQREIGLLNTRLTVLEHAHETRIEPAAFEALDVTLVDTPAPKAKRGRARKEVTDGE